MIKKLRLPLVAQLAWRIGDKGEKPAQPSGTQIKALLQHYRERPLDMIRDGVLRIVNKDGDLVRFVLNEEQDHVLSIVETEYYAKRPVRVIVLKGRQIGMSTLSMAINYVLVITSSHKSAHLVTQSKKTVLSLFRMFKNYFRYTPDGLKPDPKKCKMNQDFIEFEDSDFGIEDSRIVVDTAENRDKLSLGWTFQFNNFSEKAMWPDQQMVAGALKPTIPKKWPSVIIEESTGDKINDLFHTEYKQAKAGTRAGWYGIFFPVFTHAEYVTPLSVPLAEFMAAMAEDDKARMDRHQLSPEFMNWYIQEREDWCSKNRETAEVFRRMYPMTEEESFWGAGMSFYDPLKLEASMRRVAEQKPFLVAELPISISLKHDNVVTKFARCETLKKELSGYIGAELFDNKENGTWIIWERPRKFHKYVVSVDIAEGKEKIKGIRSSNDYSVIGVTRYSYGPDELCAMVQVAQYRSQQTDPRELAREAKAIAVIYSDFESGSDAFVIAERNGPGLAFIEQGKDDNMRFYMKQRFGSRGEFITEEMGFQSTGGESQGARISILIQARETYVRDQYLVSSIETINEMSVFSKNEKGKYEAANNDHDDTVIELSLSVECVRYLTQFTLPVPLDPMRAKSESIEAAQKRYAPPPMIDLKKWLGGSLKPVEDVDAAVGF